MLKSVFFFTLFLGVFYILEYGFAFSASDKLLRPFLLSGFTTAMVLNFELRRLVLVFSTICLILMAFTYTLNLGNLSNTIGSFGFSLLVITILLYFPQIIKKGCVEKF